MSLLHEPTIYFYYSQSACKTNMIKCVECELALLRKPWPWPANYAWIVDCGLWSGWDTQIIMVFSARKHVASVLRLLYSVVQKNLRERHRDTPNL